MVSFDNADFWISQWQQAKVSSISAQRKEGRVGGEYWDMRARGFAKLGKTQEIKERIEKMEQILKRHKRLQSGDRVLDIGCGTGNFAIPLAAKTDQVVALDPSQGMLDLLKEQAAQKNLTNVETGCVYWEDANLADHGWEKAFDVVLAMMSPGVSDVATLKKMINSCRGTCFLAGHLKRQDKGREELWKLLIGDDMPQMALDVFYIFHVLYAWGYRPDFEFEERVVTRDLAADEIYEVYLNHFYPYLELTVPIKDKIKRYIEQNSVKGVYRETRHFTIGYLCWDVQ